MLFFTCVFNSKQENIIFVFIISIILSLLLLLLLLHFICLVLLGLLSVFFLYSVYQKRIRLQMNEALLGGSGEGGMSVCLRFEVAVITQFAVAVSTNLRLLPFLLSFKAMSLAGILPYQGLNLNTKA